MSTTTKQHPRLFITKNRIDQMQDQLKTDPFFKELGNGLFKQAESILEKDPVEFEIIGPRMLKNCQEIHSRVSTLALAYHLKQDDRYVSGAVRELRFAAEYPHWNKDHFLDTAELITAFAIGYDWLFHVLNDEDKAMILSALVKKGIQVGLEEHAKNIWWAGHRFNWNQVCNGGLIIGALAIEDEHPELLKSVFEATVKHLPIAFNSYGKDGGWEGGPDYWDYTTRFSVLLVDALLQNTGDDFGLSATKGFDKTGLFPIYNSGSSGRQFNFADADPDYVHKAYPALFWLGKFFGIDASINENNRLLRISLDKDLPFDAMNLVWYAPAIANTESLPVNRIFKGIDAGYMRQAWDKNAISVAFKGGYNLADHAHLDLGTFVLDHGGHRWVSDLGRDDYDLPSYFERTVGGGRWKYFRLNTKSHNTLVINDENQKEDARAKIVEFVDSTPVPYAVLDLSDAYEAHVMSAFRKFQLVGDKGLRLTDSINGKETLNSVKWQILTAADVVVEGNTAILSIEDQQMRVTLSNPDLRFELSSADPGRPELPNDGYQLLQVSLTAFNEAKCEIAVDFEFLEN